LDAFSLVFVPLITIYPQGSASVSDAVLALPDSIGSRKKRMMVCIETKLRDGKAGCLQSVFRRD
jgi:hypothetical protein